MHSNGGGGGGGQGNPFDSLAKRKGRIGRTTKKQMTLTTGLVAPELKKGFDEFKKRGSRNSASGEQIDAAHRFSDHGIRTRGGSSGSQIQHDHVIQPPLPPPRSPSQLMSPCAPVFSPMPSKEPTSAAPSTNAGSSEATKSKISK